MKKRAFSLVEILIAVSLVAVCFLAAFSLMGRELHWASDIEDRTRGLSLARNLLNLATAAAPGGFSSTYNIFSGLAPGEDKIIDLDSTPFPAESIALGSSLAKWKQEKAAKVSFHVQREPAGATAANLGLVTCAVAWKTNKGKERSVVLSRVVGP